MKIAEALQSRKYNLRVSNGARRLVGDNGKWVIYERKPYAKKTTVVIETHDEDEAVRLLVEDSSEDNYDDDGFWKSELQGGG